jgi:hypothetical protein
MAGELFGWWILPYAWLACFAAYYVSGAPGIYRAQRAEGGKHGALLFLARNLGELKRRFGWGRN